MCVSALYNVYFLFCFIFTTVLWQKKPINQGFLDKRWWLTFFWQFYCCFFSCLQENVNTVTVTPTSGAVLFRKESNPALNNPSRPSSLQVNNSPVSSPQSSSPIPVPSQVAAYKRMCSSPSSPVGQCKQIGSSSGNLPKKVSPSFMLHMQIVKLWRQLCVYFVKFWNSLVFYDSSFVSVKILYKLHTQVAWYYNL